MCIAKKKREYGIVWQGNANIKSFVSQNQTVWDMHAHLDMVVDYESRVADEVCVKGIERPDTQKLEIKVPNVREIAENSVECGVEGIVHCACDMENILGISSVLDEISFVTDKLVGAAALHPNESILHYIAHNPNYELTPSPDGLLPNIREVHREYSLSDCVAKIESIIRGDERIKIIGETGLDYFRTSEEDSRIQKESLKMHIDLAKSLDMPVQIHDRDAHDDIVQILKAEKPQKVLFHSFSGGEELAKTCIEHGWYTSFSGPVTFNANSGLREAFWEVYTHAPELLLFETDSPFLTPMPYRGRTCTPSQTANTIIFLARFIAERGGVAFEDIMRELTAIESRNVDCLLEL